MDDRIKTIVIAFVLYILLTAPGTALQAQSPAAGDVPGSRALFLEHYLLANGTVIEGKSPFKSVNFPTYWYNENTKQLNGRVDFPINSSLIMIFGDVLTLQGQLRGRHRQ